MKKIRVAVVVVFSMFGCSDTSYKEHGETKLSQYAFTGMVELGTPVDGATILAYQFHRLQKGEKVAEAVSNRDGTFNLNPATGYNGPLLLTATGIFNGLISRFGSLVVG